MNLPLRLCLAFLASGLAAAAAPLAADSRITAVTVYADRAVVTRAATVAIGQPGEVEVTFDRLPSRLLADSLQVAGQGSADTTLLDVAARETFVDFTPNDRVRALEDELRAVGREERTLNDRAGVLQQQRDYLQRIQSSTTTPAKDGPGGLTPPDVWLKLLAFTEEQFSRIAGETRTLDDQREALQARRTALEQQLGALRGDAGRRYQTVTVRLAATSPGELALTLRYTVPAASWAPSYDARVLSGERAVQLGYFGIVRQNTGEDWNGIDLTLSTARPALGGAAPELSPWIVQLRPPATEERVVLSPFEISAQRKTVRAQDLGYAAAAPAPELRDMAAAVTTVETQATSATFRVAAKTDLPSDNTSHKVSVTTIRLQAALSYRSTPKLLPGAFLSASVTHASDYPLLAGPLNVFLDDTFVATSAVRTVMPGEKFDLALGADEAIAVTRKLNRRFVEDTGVVSKGRRVTYDLALTVHNRKPTPETIVVEDQLPVSRHEKIIVKQLAPDERQLKPDADGRIKWTLELKPGEKRELPLRFSIEHPSDLPVAGLE